MTHARVMQPLYLRSRGRQVRGPRRGGLGQGQPAASSQPKELEAAFDRFTIGHVAVGTLYGLGRFPFWLALGLSVGWELIEDHLKVVFPEIFPSALPESMGNHVVDVAGNMFGYTMIRLLFPKPAPGERY